jgi:methyl-accepting chemotaxis protein
MFDFMSNLTIKVKMVGLAICGIISFVCILSLVYYINFDSELKRLATADQETRLRMFWNLLESKGSNIDIVDNKLKVGDYVINDNFELPDKMKKLCGGTATIFMRDERISTNVMKPDGTRATGTKLQGPAYDAIFKDQKQYRGETKILGTTYFTAYDPIKNSKGEIIGVLYTGIKKSEYYSAFNTLITHILLLTLIVTVGTALLWLWVVNSMITNPMDYVIKRIKDIVEGEGDLTKRVNARGNDEIGKLGQGINAFLSNFENIIAKVKETSSQVNTTTQEVAAGSQGLSQSTQEQASAVEQVAATIEQMTSSIKQNASHADKGRDMTSSLVQKTTVTRESTKDLMKAMDEISLSSKKIGDIIITVNEVAFQTNLLALNAAVEAARAGEHGKGFAVVAQEVRSLAQRSAEAAKQIKEMIQDTVNKVNAGDDIVKKAVISLQEIIGHIDMLSQTMDEISSSSNEQAVGVDEVNRAISQIDTTTQQNASTVEELAAAAGLLSTEAEDLNEIVARFKVSDDLLA